MSIINFGKLASIDSNGFYLTSNGQPSHFNQTEMSCKCGCGESRMSQPLIDADAALRVGINMPITIDRGVSCTLHNFAVGGAADSEHLPISYASDKIAAMPEEDFFLQARKTHNRLGLYFGEPGMIHADMKVDATGAPLHLYWYRLNGTYTYFTNPVECLNAYRNLK